MANIGYATITLIPSARGFATATARQLQQPIATASRSAGLAAGKAIQTSLSAGGRQGAAAVKQAVTKSADDSAGHITRAFRGAFRTLSVYATGYLAISAAVRTVGAAATFAGDSIIGFNSRLQQAQIAFSTFFGNARKASDFIGQLEAFAKRTPFQFEGVIQAGQQLTAMGIAAKDVIPTLTAIGDAAAGVGASSETLQRIVLAFGQIASKGRVQSDELLQLQEAGIPALKILAAQYGLTTVQMQKMISSGQVLSEQAIPLLVKGLEKGTATTQKFGGMMAKQSKTFSGALSNIHDSLQIALAQAFRPFFGEISSDANSLAKSLNSAAVSEWAQRMSADVSRGLSALKGITTFLRSGAFSIDLQKAFGIDADSDVFRGMTRVRDLVVGTFGDLGRAASSVLDDLRTLTPSVAQLAGFIGGALLLASRDFASILANDVAPVLSTVADGLRVVLDAVNALPTPVKAVGLALAAAAIGARLFGDTLASAQVKTLSALTTMRTRAGEVALAWKLAGAEASTAGNAFQRLGSRLQTTNMLIGGTSGLKRSLGGLLGVFGGPWGLAITGAAVGIGIFAQKQAEARARVDELTASLDQQSAAVTKQTFVQVAQSIGDALGPSTLARLQTFGITLQDMTSAAIQGGPALANLKARLKDNLQAINGSTDAYSVQNHAINEAIGLLDQQSGAVATAISRQQAIAAATQAGASAFDLQAGAIGRVNEAISKIPTQILITAQTKGFGDATAAIMAAWAAIKALNSEAENPGGAFGPGTAAGDAARRYNSAGNALLASIRQQKAAIAAAVGDTTASVTSGGAGAGSIAGMGTKAAQAARGVAKSYLQSLIDAFDNGRAAVARAAGRLLEAVRRQADRQDAGSAIIRKIKSDNDRLIKLAGTRESLANRLQKANDKLDSLKQKAQELADATAAGISSLFDASSLTNVNEMVRALTVNVQAAQAFQANLTTLAKRGLNATTISQLAQAGAAAAGDSARALATASDTQIAQINKLQGTLNKTAGTAGDQLADALYGAGEKAARGLIKGLRSRMKDIEALMLRIARAMTKAIRKALGIKSPSSVFAELGAQIPNGLVKGIESRSHHVDRAVSRMVNVPGAGRAGSTAVPAPTNVFQIVAGFPQEVVRQVDAHERRQQALYRPAMGI